MTLMVSPLPFATWEMDTLGPFPKASGHRKYLFVAVDYFTKWIEAKAVTSITTTEVRKFIWWNVITYFGIPRAIIFDSGRQFDTSKLIDYLSNLGCYARFTIVAHPRPTAKPRRPINLSSMTCRRYLTTRKVLWSLRPPEKTATGETPFMLAYGSEAVLPVEVTLHTH